MKFINFNMQLFKMYYSVLVIRPVDCNSNQIFPTFNPFPNKPWFLAPLAVGQRAYVMVRFPSCVRASVRLCVNFFFKHLLR